MRITCSRSDGPDQLGVAVDPVPPEPALGVRLGVDGESRRQPCPAGRLTARRGVDVELASPSERVSERRRWQLGWRQPLGRFATVACRRSATRRIDGLDDPARHRHQALRQRPGGRRRPLPRGRARARSACSSARPGCGKTTTMRMINRLIEPTSGRILLDGDDVTDVDPVELRRRIGYVIQQIGLFPHQTVGDNIGTVPAPAGLGQDAGPGRGSTSCSSWSASTRRVPRPLPAPALGRPASAGRRGPGPRRRSARAADGRAVRRHRPDHPRAAAGRVPAPPGRRCKQDDRVRHPRHRGGGEARRPHRHPPAGRRARPVRHAGRRSSADPASDVRGRLRRAPTGRSSGSRSPRSTRATRRSRRWCRVDSSLGEARSRMDADDIDFAVVLDDERPAARLPGAGRADGEGTVGDGSSASRPGSGRRTHLKDAFARCCSTTPGGSPSLDADDRSSASLTAGRALRRRPPRRWSPTAPGGSRSRCDRARRPLRLGWRTCSSGSGRTAGGSRRRGGWCWPRCSNGLAPTSPPRTWPPVSRRPIPTSTCPRSTERSRPSRTWACSTHTHLGHGPSTYHLTDRPHHHAVCHGCGAWSSYRPTASTSSTGGCGAEHGFELEGQHFALVGRCRRCRTADPLSDPSAIPRDPYSECWSTRRFRL